MRSFTVARSGTDWAVPQAHGTRASRSARRCGDGAYTLVASQSGPGGTGNASSAFHVDSTAPAPVLTGPSTTADRTPKLTGSAGTASGDDGFVRVRVYAGSIAGGSALKDVNAGVGSGGGFAAAVGLLADGAYVATASQSDAAGNADTSAPLHFTVAAGAARIALVRNVANNRDVYTQALDGSGVVNLSNDVAIDEAPSFSLDGTRMVFTSTTGSFIADPAWSPDSAHLLFTSTSAATGTDTIGLIDADGTGQSTIPTGPGLPRQATWQPEPANAPPAVELSAANDVSCPKGATRTYGYAISDPEAHAISAVTTSCGAAGHKVPGSDDHTNAAGSFACTFPDGPAASTVSASATDAEGGTGADGHAVRRGGERRADRDAVGRQPPLGPRGRNADLWLRDRRPGRRHGRKRRDELRRKRREGRGIRHAHDDQRQLPVRVRERPWHVRRVRGGRRLRRR